MAAPLWSLSLPFILQFLPDGSHFGKHPSDGPPLKSLRKRGYRALRFSVHAFTMSRVNSQEKRQVTSPASLDDLRLQLEKRFGAAPFARPKVREQRDTGEGGLWPPVGMGEGEVSEWIALHEGSGQVQLAFCALRQRTGTSSRWMVLDSAAEMYGPAIENLGLSLSNVVFVRVQNRGQALWATEQGLRSRGVDVVVCRMEKIAPFAFRRLKMAAESGGARLLLFRGAHALREATAADVRLVVSPQLSSSWRRRRYRVEFLKIRSGAREESVQVECDEETGVVRVVAKSADSASDMGREIPKSRATAPHLSVEPNRN